MSKKELPTNQLIQEISQLRETLADAQSQISQLSAQNQQLKSELEFTHEAKFPPSKSPITSTNEPLTNRLPLSELLHHAAVISQQISTVREPDHLVGRAIDLIRQSFGLYHVHIYRLDEEGQLLRVHRGVGDVGKQMQAQGQFIPLLTEKSLVALAARERRMILVQNVREEAQFLPNPLLPETMSELSIPLEYGRTLLGILDIQDSRANRFSPGEIDVFISLAGSVAIALRNAQLFTELHQTQNKLLYQANLMQNVSDAIIATDNQFCIQSWNKAAEAIYGWSEAEVLGKKMNDIVPQIYTEQSHEAVMAEFLAQGQWQGRLKQQRRNGSDIPIFASVTAVKNHSGTIIGAVAVNRDITNQLAIEESLRQHMQLLQASNADLAQFAYVASHDLQEPLRMITAYLQLLVSTNRGKLDEESQEFIDFALDGANRMRQLITDLLAYSRVGRQNESFNQVDLDQTLAQVRRNLEIQIEENEVTLTHDPLPTIFADKTQMLQLLQNLISNAIKFKSPKDPHIHLSAKQENAQWIISVSDNGIGIDPQFSERIFTIFQRLHTPDEYPGTGIGLALCKKIVQKHGGDIWVDSAPGAGATFSFSIPAQVA